jgi:hypothetical protein
MARDYFEWGSVFCKEAEEVATQQQVRDLEVAVVAFIEGAIRNKLRPTFNAVEAKL